MVTSKKHQEDTLSVSGGLLRRFRAYYDQQKIAGKLNLLLLLMILLIVINNVIVLFSLYVIYTRNETLSTLGAFVEQVAQMENAQQRFRISQDRTDALSTKKSLDNAKTILNLLPPTIFPSPTFGETSRVQMLLRTFETRFNEYLFNHEQTAALESGMRNTEADLLKSIQALRASSGQDSLSPIRASIVQSVLDARIIQQEFVILRDMSLSARMDVCVASIASNAILLRARSTDVAAQIEAYNIGQQALRLGNAFDKLREYTKKKIDNEQIMAKASTSISQNLDEASSVQRAAISKQLFIVLISMLSASVVIVALGVLLGRQFVRDITTSLKQLVRVSGNIAQGDYNHELAVASRDEIGELTASFSEMANTVKQQIGALLESEQRVMLRTAELEMANRSLAQAKQTTEALNESLETKVSERTAELIEANRKLSELTVTDALTGLANRRRFDAALADEWSRAGRTEQPLSIFMIDIDYFKLYNDHYGHQAGDECLHKVANSLLSSARRASDLVARYGGEEFVVIAADLDIIPARELAETMRRSVELLAIPHAFSLVEKVVTVSIGISVMTPDGNLQAEHLLRGADEALYRAKDGGRNRVTS